MTTAVLEVRTYRLHEGRLASFDDTMRLQSVPLLREFGIDVVHAGPSETAEDGITDYVLVRAYPSHDERDRQELAFYSSEEWRTGPAGAVLAAIAGYHTITLTVDARIVESLRGPASTLLT